MRPGSTTSTAVLSTGSEGRPEAPDPWRRALAWGGLALIGLVALAFAVLTVRFLLRPERRGPGHIERRPLKDGAQDPATGSKRDTLEP